MPSLPLVFCCLQYAKTEERFGNDARGEGLGKTKLNIVTYCLMNICLCFTEYGTLSVVLA